MDQRIRVQVGLEFGALFRRQGALATRHTDKPADVDFHRHAALRQALNGRERLTVAALQVHQLPRRGPRRPSFDLGARPHGFHIFQVDGGGSLGL